MRQAPKAWAAVVSACAILMCGCPRSAPSDAGAAAPMPAVPHEASVGSALGIDGGSQAGVGAGAGDGGRLPTAAYDPTVITTGEGLDFMAQASTLFRVAACGSSGDLPARFDADVIRRHCADLARAYREYKKDWVALVERLLGPLRPRDLPRVVVYPFGGGDLVSALATFPEAQEITTISLEPAGDVRAIDRLAPAKLAAELAGHRARLERLFAKAHSRTENLGKEARTELPGEIVFDLAALVVHGYEPLSLRYFRLRPDGSLAYVTRADIDAVAHNPAAQHALFQNVELRFRLAEVGSEGARADGGGAPATQPAHVLRHIAFNLDDEHLKADGALLAHLNVKGKVSAMTKAATHLLWNPHFGLIRDWLLSHTDWMVSDSTGVPVRYAKEAGFALDTYGKFDGPALFGEPDARDGADLKHAFASQPSRPLPLRYGYPDKNGHGHLVIMHKEDAPDGGAGEPPGSVGPSSGAAGK